MIKWILMLAVLTFLSYLSDVGKLSSLHDLRVPFLNASVLSVLLLLCMAGLLGRMLWKVKKGEKEILANKIFNLEKELKALHEKEK